MIIIMNYHNYNHEICITSSKFSVSNVLILLKIKTIIISYCFKGNKQTYIWNSNLRYLQF